MPPTDEFTRSRISPQFWIGAVTQFFRRSTRAERIGYGVGALLLASGIVHAAILIVSGATWEGPLSLRKPMTFGLSFGLTLITIIWVSVFVQLTPRTRSLLLSVLIGACFLETALVSLQTWRGAPSHFNVETPFDATVARILAVGGFTLIIVIAILTYASIRTGPPVPMSLRIATRTGFITLLGAQIVGAAMIARGMALVFAGNAKAAYLTAGSLKPMHAVLMHGVLVLPALAWLLSFGNWSEQRRTTIVLLAAAGYVILVAAVALANLGPVTG